MICTINNRSPASATSPSRDPMHSSTSSRQTRPSAAVNGAKALRRGCLCRCRPSKPCIFCDILKQNSSGASGSRVLYQDKHVWALPDIRPAAVQHLLVLPKVHIPNVSSLTPADAPLVRHMLVVGQQLLAQELASQQQHGAPLIAGQQQQPVFKFGFHKPPFRSIDHLHLHCFQLPHKMHRWVQYQASINWITAEQLLDQLARQPSSPSRPAAPQPPAARDLQRGEGLQVADSPSPSAAPLPDREEGP